MFLEALVARVEKQKILVHEVKEAAGVLGEPWGPALVANLCHKSIYGDTAALHQLRCQMYDVCQFRQLCSVQCHYIPFIFE